MPKTVFITGSNRGIGKETAIIFAERGWNIIAHSRKKSDDFDEFTKRLAIDNKTEVIPIYFDMRNEDDMKEQIKSVISKPRITIDALVNNAGIMEIKLFMMTTVSSIREVFENNLFSHMKLTQLIIKRMPAGSSIVNIASMDAYEPQRGESAYASSKAAMIAWTEVLKKELMGQIRVNAVAPHSVNTDMAHNVADKAVWDLEDLIDPRAIAKTIFFLTSDDAEAVTGDVIKINGNHKE